MEPGAQLDHFMYPKSDLKEADAVAWVAVDPTSPLAMYSFKFPELSSDEVRLKVLYTSICRSDILTIRGSWGLCEYPCCPGHEIVGEITMVGKDVTDKKVGDIVGVSPIRKSCLKCEYCKSGRSNLCAERVFTYGEGWFGGYATHVQIEHHWAWPIPKNLPLDKAAPLLCAGLTVYVPIKRHGHSGDRCAVLGIGGLGHLAVQYASKLGMKVTAFTTKPDKKKQLHDLGATSISHSTDLTQLKQQQGKYDLVVNTLFVSNEQVVKAHQRLTAPGGTYLAIGVPDEHTQMQMDSAYLSRYQIKLVGSIVASIEDGIDTLRFSSEYNVLPYCEFFDFQDFNKALDWAEKGNPKFRCVVNVKDWAKKNGFDK